MKRADRKPLSLRHIGSLYVAPFGAALAAERRAEDLGVIPTPQEVTWTDETLPVDKQTTILVPAAAPSGVKFAAEMLKKRLREANGPRPADQ